MANVANVTVTQIIPYAANLRPIPVILDSGPYTTHEMAAVLNRAGLGQPISGGGVTIPQGPQRWPI
jgi:hypothetical protein